MDVDYTVKVFSYYYYCLLKNYVFVTHTIQCLLTHTHTHTLRRARVHSLTCSAAYLPPKIPMWECSLKIIIIVKMQMRSKTSQLRASKIKKHFVIHLVYLIYANHLIHIYVSIYTRRVYIIIYKIIINYDTQRLLHLSLSRRDSLLLLNAIRVQSVTIYLCIVYI